MIDLKREIERELSLIDPPDLWDRIQADASSNGAVLDLATARHRRRPSLWLAVAAVTVLFAFVSAVVLLDDPQTLDTTPATEVPMAPTTLDTEVPVAPEPPTTQDRPTTVARGDVEILSPYGEGVEIDGPWWTGLVGQTLNIDAVEQNGEVTGEFRVNNVVAALECADIKPNFGEIRLGGEVTDDPDGQGLAVIDGDVAVGDRVALIIRDGGRIALYADDGAGSCTELLESVRDYLDGGLFGYAGGEIETGEETVSP